MQQRVHRGVEGGVPVLLLLEGLQEPQAAIRLGDETVEARAQECQTLVVGPCATVLLPRRAGV